MAAVSPPPMPALKLGNLTSRPTSEFDAGINASTAWTEHLERASTYDSDASSGKDEEKPPKQNVLVNGRIRPARALYPFEGQVEFKELAGVQAGDIIEILKEDLAGGWSLARLLPTPGGESSNASSEPGLIPRTYYAFTADFSALPLPNDISPVASGSSTPKPVNPIPAQPLQLQPTGSGYVFPYLRQNLMGGKSFNRFSTFVTTGTEEFLLRGASGVEPAPSHYRDSTAASSDGEEDAENDGTYDFQNGNGKKKSGTEADRHYIESPPSWRSKSPPFRIIVHSPSKRASTITGSYTLYAVTSLFKASLGSEPSPPTQTQTHVTVHRRFSHFTFLHAALSRYLPGIALPPLPEKQYAGRFNDDFVEARRGDLERWLSRIVRHPLARYSEVLVFFLGCESDSEWRRALPHFLSQASSTSAPGPAFYAHVYHPLFNLDVEDAEEAVDRFQTHLRGVGKSVQAARGVFAGLREGVLQLSAAQRAFSFSLISLLTSTPLASYGSSNGAPNPLAYSYGEQDEEDEEEYMSPSKLTKGKSKGLMNQEGAWCWREGCEECLRLSKAIQKTAECLQSVADLHDDHARRTQLATHESLKDVAHPSQLYAGVIDTHRSTLSRYKQAVLTSEASGQDSDAEMVARCETVLNTTMAEFETYHIQKGEDVQKVITEHLDGEIALYEQALTRLRTARASFAPPPNPTLPPGPRQPSIYEQSTLKAPLPLPQPAAHVFDSTGGIRPVSVAVRESIGIIFGGSGGGQGGASGGGVGGRGSVFGRFW